MGRSIYVIFMSILDKGDFGGSDTKSGEGVRVKNNSSVQARQAYSELRSWNVKQELN